MPNKRKRLCAETGPRLRGWGVRLQHGCRQRSSKSAGQRASLKGRHQMPYKSEAQRGFFHDNRKKLAAQGVNVAEWDEASQGKKLPERMPSREKAGSAARRRRSLPDGRTPPAGGQNQ